eukprot:SAG31_NODE_957_length_10768_cov_3.322992_7_plen_113_part_00
MLAAMIGSCLAAMMRSFRRTESIRSTELPPHSFVSPQGRKLLGVGGAASCGCAATLLFPGTCLAQSSDGEHMVAAAGGGAYHTDVRSSKLALGFQLALFILPRVQPYLNLGT